MLCCPEQVIVQRFNVGGGGEPIKTGKRSEFTLVQNILTIG